MKKFLISIGVVILAAILAECFLWLFFLYPNLNRSSEFFKHPVQWIYSNYDRNAIQYLPDCARYDPALTYTLKPGSCTFQNREFNTTYSINSMGLRDDEQSLTAPRIISLGDSYAMGWGVEQEETYTQILERESGLLALNAGMSSYGTARELLLFRKLDQSRLKYLLIQYCANDFAENESFLENGNTLPIMPIKEYQQITAQHANRSSYWPFLYLMELIKFYYHQWYVNEPVVQRSAAGNSLLTAHINYEEKDSTGYPYHRSPEQVAIDLREARAFLAVLAQFEVADSVQVVFIDIQSALPEILPGLIAETDHDDYINNMIFLNTANFIDKDDFFALDGHITREAHKKIADRLLKKLKL